MLCDEVFRWYVVYTCICSLIGKKVTLTSSDMPVPIDLSTKYLYDKVFSTTKQGFLGASQRRIRNFFCRIQDKTIGAMLLDDVKFQLFLIRLFSITNIFFYVGSITHCHFNSNNGHLDYELYILGQCLMHTC